MGGGHAGLAAHTQGRDERPVRTPDTKSIICGH